VLGLDMAGQGTLVQLMTSESEWTFQSLKNELQYYFLTKKVVSSN